MSYSLEDYIRDHDVDEADIERRKERLYKKIRAYKLKEEDNTQEKAGDAAKDTARS